MKKIDTYTSNSPSFLSRVAMTTTVFLSLLWLFQAPARSQGNSSSGTEYYLVFMPNGPNYGVIRTEAFLASGQANQVQVEYGGNVRSIQMTPSSTFSLDGPWTTSVQETPVNNAVHITSKNPITCYGYSVWGSSSSFIGGGSPDGYLALPVTGFGTDYITMNYYDSQFGGFKSAGEFIFVASEDNTHVTITAHADTRSDAMGTLSHKAGVPWTTTLMKGQVYLVQSTGNNTGSDDLTGSFVHSDKPIGLVSGHEITPIPLGEQTSADHLCEMLLPLDRWGTQYYHIPMAGRTIAGDYLRIISGEDGNIITYDNGKTFLLNAGEYAEETIATTPQSFVSSNHKKFLVFQFAYSQYYNGDPSPSDPFMIMMEPREQFQKKVLFRTPRPYSAATFNNFVTIITDDTSFSKVKINGLALSAYQYAGRTQFPGTNPLVGAYRVRIVGGSNTSFLIQSPTPMGLYQYGFADYEAYGWPTGMALNVSSRDTLPPVEKRTEACGNYTFQFAEQRHIPQFSFEDTRISDYAMITDTGDARWAIPSFNYTFTRDPNFQVGDSLASGSLTVDDPRKNAYAAIWVTDRAGNDIVYEYHYYAPALSVTPIAGDSIYRFSTTTLGADSCQQVLVKNTQTSGPLHITRLGLTGTTAGGKFAITPAGIDTVLQPGESIKVNICYTPSDTSTVAHDTLTVGPNCVAFPFALIGSGVTPLIYASDVNFGSVDTGKSKCLPVTIKNVGRALLTIQKQDLTNDPNFSIDPLQTFPIYLKPGASTTIQYCFHPTQYGNFSKTVLFTNSNPALYAHSIKDTSQLLGVSLQAGAKLTSLDNNFGTLTCDQTALFTDTLFNDRSLSEQIDTVTITGPDASSFSIVSVKPLTGYPFSLDPGLSHGVIYTIKYDPNIAGPNGNVRKALFSAITHDGRSKPIATLQGSRKAPLGTIAPANGSLVNLGIASTNSTLTKTITISNTGTDNLIGTLVLTGANPGTFTLNPTAINVAPGGSQIITVSATSGKSGLFSASINFQPGACGNALGLSTQATFSNTKDLATGATYPNTFTCQSNNRSGSYYNLNSNDPVKVTDITIENVPPGKDASQFIFAKPIKNNLTVAAQDSIQVPIRFVPTSTGVKTAVLVFHLSLRKPDGTDSTYLDSALLSGISSNIQSVVGVGNITGTQTYNGTAGVGAANNVIQVAIVADKPIAPLTNEVYGYSFDLSWLRDAFTFNGVATTPDPAITLKQTGSKFDPVTNRETFTFSGTSATPIPSLTNLGTIPLSVMLDTSNTTTIVASNAHWLSKNLTDTLCYIATTTKDGVFNYDSQCGDQTLRSVLGGQAVPFSIEKMEPNPFKDKLTVQYNVNRSGTAVTLAIYDALGAEVQRVIDRVPMERGHYTATFSGASLSSGQYYCRLTDGKKVVTVGILLQK